MKRIITIGQIGSGTVELLTEPIQLKNKDLFSLRIIFELVTFPSIHQLKEVLAVIERTSSQRLY